MVPGVGGGAGVGDFLKMYCIDDPTCCITGAAPVYRFGVSECLY